MENAIPLINHYPADSVFVLLTLIHWIAIYPVDNVNQPSNNQDQIFSFRQLSIHSPRIQLLVFTQYLANTTSVFTKIGLLWQLYFYNILFQIFLISLKIKFHCYSNFLILCQTQHSFVSFNSVRQFSSFQK